MWANRIKQRLGEGETVYGPLVRIPSPVSVEAAAAAGFDFVFIDMEHSPIELPLLEPLLLAAAAGGVTPLVRVPEVSRVGIQRVLELGAHGVIVPLVSTEAEARLVSDATRFAPEGSRGMAGPVRGDGWASLPLQVGMERMNREVLTAAQVESAGALEILDLMASLPGIDVLFVGPNDLSQALGLPGEVNHPRVIEAIDSVIDSARRHGKQAGIYAATPQAAAFWRERGVRVIAIGLDTIILKQAFSGLVAALRT